MNWSDTVSNILTSGNAIPVLLSALLVVAVFAVMLRKGHIQIHTKSVDLGVADKERDILRQQGEWLTNHYQGTYSILPRGERFDEYRAKYILERALDKAQEWIMFNHMSVENSYMDIKKDAMKGLIRSLTDEPIYHSQDFMDFIDRDTETVIRTCVLIREKYK